MPSTLIEAGLAAVLLVIGFFRKPGKTVGVLLLAAPLIWGFGAADFDAKGDQGLTLVAVVSAIVTLAGVGCILIPSRDRDLICLRRAAVFYCLATLPSIFLSARTGRSLGGYLRLISPILFLFICWRCCERKLMQTYQLRAIAFSTGSMCLVVGLAIYAGKDSYYMGGFDRLRAFTLSPQHISLYSVVLVNVLIAGMLISRSRLLYFLGIPPLLVFTYLTGYRTAWAGLVISAVIILTVAIRSGIVKFAAIMSTILLAAAMLGGLMGTFVHSFTRYGSADEDVSEGLLNKMSSGRIQTDAIALEHYLAESVPELLFGTGVYSSEMITLEGEGTGYIVHDDYLATLVECGIIGAAAYIGFVAALGWVLLVRIRRLPGGHPVRTLTAVAFACYTAFTIMGIPSALYTNVFIGWYYYGFLAIVLAQPYDFVNPVQHTDESLAVSSSRTLIPA